MRRPRGMMLALALAASCGCERDPAPEEVWVPASPPEVEVTVRPSSSAVRVGEPVRLYATRRTSGAWKRVLKRSLAEDACWMVRPPPSEEPAVADNLRWHVDPDRDFRFNLGVFPDHRREVTFEAPGRYVLRAESSVWCGDPVRSHAITIEVHSENRDGSI